MDDDRGLAPTSVSLCLLQPDIEVACFNSLAFQVASIKRSSTRNDNVWAIRATMELLASTGVNSKLAKIFCKFAFTGGALLS